jgi:hypothetical protein
MHRPDCAAAVGTTCHDLNRLAWEVTALQRLEPQVVLLWSLASTVYGGPHEETLRRAYAALNFTGVPLGFVTERQLGEGRGRKGKEGTEGERGDGRGKRGRKRTEGKKEKFLFPLLRNPFFPLFPLFPLPSR